ncbi:response regulator [Cellvibrio japonicus]|uniref:Response regulator n=1 Tax=Cellvibrio japonicus (strain Ueda107) TaxID=498211 RepID=B3PF43_CELJU|nr:response regulator [Cellvibrio japonicus]ACE85769.1 response regulator [Cellvibrio japonicus Ueda107]QEI13600.1 response regulator [Cellvibrio japonicus]QEI17174.1 response regulator [Cellvibrio japonicus]QEI20751.1 response regulator [Cellvibrio japonicus]
MSKPLERILYVEDDPDIQAIALMVLDSISGFTVEPCSSGSEALEKAEAFGPDLILLDVMMPGMDGPETLRALRQFPSLQPVPVVFMTAKVQPQEVREYLNLGASGVIAKPFDPMTLSQQLIDIWAHARQ